ncbi:hypothetical protein AC578_2982 [Pseudocercospora eumusae]|uniref:CENP-V/GFA domain-containing protein n=1 Tax=Pseudocercospora eumusae TaxID=321146 RepID=A0A139HEA9_9PEZI|nr:hypothetical protein AC578_2982 [Pseudocercospora eumusae]
MSSPKIFLPSEHAHGEENGTATATCYCGAVQIQVPTEGTIDDFALQETKFKPRIETFEKDRCAWVRPAGVQEHVDGAYYTAGKEWKSLHDGVGGKGE